MNRKHFGYASVVISILLVFVVAFMATMLLDKAAASANASADETCVPQSAWTETIPAHEGQWWNWSPNHEQGPFEGPPSFPVDDRGTWQGPHTEGGPEGEGTFQTGNGHGSWFHREPATPEQVIFHPAVVCDEEPPPVTDRDVCSNLQGVQLTPPRGAVIRNGECVMPEPEPEPTPATHHTPKPKPHVGSSLKAYCVGNTWVTVVTKGVNTS